VPESKSLRARVSALLALSVGCIISVATASLLLAQVFRGGVTAVTLDVVVTDKDGESVTNLTKDDFEIIEEGRRVEILSATLVSLPASRAARADQGDVWTNRDSQNRRVFTIVIDDLDTPPEEIGRARDVVRRFVDAVPDGDLLAVVYCGQQRGAQEFTTDKSRILKSLEAFSGRQPDPVEDSAGGERRENFVRVFATLQNATRYVAGVPDRRKAILFVTEKLPRALTTAIHDNSAVGEAFRTLLSDASDSHVAIYPVDYTGLSRESGDILTPLRTLAEETGGLAIENTNGFPRAFAQMIQDSSTYYLVAYAPLIRDKPSSKPQSRRVSVRVTRLGAVARTRHTYSTRDTAHSKDAAGRMPDVPLASGSLPVAMHVAWLATVQNRARVVSALQIGGSGIGFTEKAGGYSASVRYRVLATDTSGKVMGVDTQTLAFHVTAKRYGQINDSGSRVVSSFDLKPGSYHVRATVLDEQSQEFGAVVGDLDVPNLSKPKAPLMSSVMVSSMNNAKIPTLRHNAVMFEGRLTAPPTTSRRFSRDDGIEIYGEVYPSDPSHASATATLTLVDVASRPVLERNLSMSLEKGIAGARCFPVRFMVHPNDVEPGRYAFRVDVQVGAFNLSRQVFATIE
jgi:VWFA-related protein